ncbi:MAG: ElyC/SanA/YdcF family protein [Lacunisphaera sp.]
MSLSLFKKRLLPCPTPLGWLVLLLAIGSPCGWWVWRGESFLRLTERQPAECLIVEGWIGIDGVTAAKAEFEQGGYRYIVTAGGLTDNRWGREHWNYAIEAGELLVRLGVPADRVVIAPAPDAETHRTFEAASVAKQMLMRLNLHAQYANVFTFGPHARRSRLVFAKAMGSSTKVGVIAWAPAHAFDGPWWHSSERALDLLKETVGYAFELLLNSGRMTNQPPPDATGIPGR